MSREPLPAARGNDEPDRGAASPLGGAVSLLGYTSEPVASPLDSASVNTVSPPDRTSESAGGSPGGVSSPAGGSLGGASGSAVSPLEDCDPDEGRPMVRVRRWGGALVGGEVPLLAVSTTAPTLAGCLDQVLAARRAGADVVELRGDLLQEVQEAGGGDPRLLARLLARAADAVVRALEDADAGAAASPVPGAVVGSVPGAAPGAAEEAEGRVTRPGVLVTLRTRSQGGGLDLDRSGYRAVLGALAEGYLEGAGLRRPDAVDVEAYCAGLYVPGGRDLEEARADLRLLAGLVHRAGLDVVASCHDLSGTPEEDETMDLLIDMQDDGADVVKLAATPHDAVDVARLLNATACAREILSVPLVTMSMGEQGAVTRVAGGVFGSALTFVLVPGPDGSWTPSAPGQLPIESVRAVHEVLGLHRGAGAGYEVAAGPRGHTMCP
ncbi:type I 3-dehydroquinate dehydratase [Actinomyces sp. oral taxon 897]|uniref:type I 3-dehydroquinate dehydratase n=1 Tax=Actinomyces sp. oral taxon 897 TaxID=2081702 RepID=UPI0020C55258|nr:type I 3-dehydroquinate dehydratase [Actinomyces sp. oral taxon 897]